MNNNYNYRSQPVGDGTFDASHNQFDPGQELPMAWWKPAIVRRIAYFATVEVDGALQNEPEAMLLLTDEDQHAWMRVYHERSAPTSMPASNDSGEIQPGPFVRSLSHGQRMLLVSDYIASPAMDQLFCPGRDCHCELHAAQDIWTKVIFAKSAPLRPSRALAPPHPGCKFPDQGP